MKFSKETIELIRRTIDEKWIPILKDEGLEKGTIDCLLCHKFVALECKRCPVRFFHGEKGCKNTPFDEWVKHHLFHHPLGERLHRKVECPICQEIAQREVDCLEEVYRRALLLIET